MKHAYCCFKANTFVETILSHCKQGKITVEFSKDIHAADSVYHR